MPAAVPLARFVPGFIAEGRYSWLSWNCCGMCLAVPLPAENDEKS